MDSVIDHFMDRSKSMILFGDTHGNINDMLSLIKNSCGTSIFHVGDFGNITGGVLSNNDLIRIETALRKNGNVMYIVRGNHDNPKCFPEWLHDKMSENDKMVYKSLKSLVFLRDYSIINMINLDRRILTVGGAISISRSKQSPGKNWWPEELYRYEENKIDYISNKYYGITDIITHTAPDFTYPDLPSSNTPESIDIILERSQISSMYNTISKRSNVHRWYHGHFHRHMVSYIDNMVITSMGYNSHIIG